MDLNTAIKMAIEALQHQKDDDIGNYYANSMSTYLPETGHYDAAIKELQKLLTNAELVE